MYVILDTYFTHSAPLREDATSLLCSPYAVASSQEWPNLWISSSRILAKKRSPDSSDNNYVYVPILKISSNQVVDQPVVILSVEGDESYVAGNVTAHNCTNYCPTGALDYTPDYELAEYDRELLLWSPERLSRPAPAFFQFFHRGGRSPSEAP